MMKFTLENQYDVRVYPVFTSNPSNGIPLLETLKARDLFSGKNGEIFYQMGEADKPTIVLIGLGAAKDVCANCLRKAYFKVGQQLRTHREQKATIVLPEGLQLSEKEVIQSICEGLLHSTYQFDHHKSDVKPAVSLTIAFDGVVDQAAAKAGIDLAQTLMEGVFITRDLVNEPANVIYPETLAQRAEAILSPLGVEVQIHDRESIEQIGMKAFLTVARGSAKAPKLIVMNYNGNPDSSERTALVGKGLTYDSGGYSIKPTTSMDTMFCDMGGAGTVIGTMAVLAKLKPRVNVTAVVAACENMISGDAYRPGDIIETMAGKSVHIVNTDAEGRLTLADAVYFATAKDHLNCDRVIDLATLTGACLVALGEFYTGVLTNDEAFEADFEKAAKRAGERVWRLPNDPDFADFNKAEMADLKNTGGRFGGTITAGQFVGAFVADEKPWIHLDIAGTAYIEKAYGYLNKGATGVHVQALTYLLCGDEI